LSLRQIHRIGIFVSFTAALKIAGVSSVFCPPSGELSSRSGQVNNRGRKSPILV
jgi:hypothetical protein